MNFEHDIRLLAQEFKKNQKILLALGDENRQHLILQMMQLGECEGARIGVITEKTNLSRPAVSHHIKILKDAGLIKMRLRVPRIIIILMPTQKPCMISFICWNIP